MTIHKAFVASTYRDLAEHRRHVIGELQKSGVFVDPMEVWTAATQAPRQLSVERLIDVDICVLLVARRRGHIPRGGRLSITQLEYQAALEREMEMFVFMLDDNAEWPEEFDERAEDPSFIRWRENLQEAHTVGTFSADPTSVEISHAVTRWALERRTATPISFSFPDNFADLEVDEMVSSEAPQIEQDLMRMSERPELNTIVVKLRSGNAWWSTRLFLLASLIRDHLPSALVAFTNGGFVGVAEPADVAAAIATHHLGLTDRYVRLDGMGVPATIRTFIDSYGPGEERQTKTWVTADTLQQVLGPRLHTAVQTAPDTDAAANRRFLLDILRTRSPYVTVLSVQGSIKGVVDRAALATEIAEDQVARGLE